MPAGTTITTTTDPARPPCGWFTGWLYVLLVGSCVGAVTGYYVSIGGTVLLTIGLLLGFAVNLLILCIKAWHRPPVAKIEDLISFPMIQIQASALAFALVARRRWFGVA